MVRAGLSAPRLRDAIKQHVERLIDQLQKR
jgi:hypothetical protein